MAKFKLNWPQIKSALRGDAKILIGNTQGQAATNPKAAAIGAGVILASVLLISYAFKSKSAAKTPSAHKIAEMIPIPSAASLYDFRDPKQLETTRTNTLHLTLKPGQSLGPLLQNNGVDSNTAYATTQAFAKTYSPKDLRVGQKINLYFSDNGQQFNGLTLKPRVDSTVFVERKLDGSFASRKIMAEYQKDIVRVGSKIDNSLYLDAGRLGAPDKVIVQFAQIYAHSVDFQRDIRAGDEFEMMFELYRDHKGNTVKAGDLVYTSFSPRGKTSSYYLYTKSDGREGYYDALGKGAKRMLMRTPVNGARLSSRFGRRKHPVLGYRRAHKGVDFAAPRGTPIMAAGTGTIVRSSRFGSFGNYIRIRHSDGYSTAYAHLSKYARGVKKGRRVTQGQIIGYVGTTGRSTGPHLHYEVLKNGRQINPMTLSTLSGKPLKKDELPAFKVRMGEIDELRKQAGPAKINEAELAAELETEQQSAVPAKELVQ